MSKPCAWCESTLHSSTFCFFRPRKAVKIVRKLINRVGPVTAKWIETRHEWIQANPPDASGEWDCYFPKGYHHPLCPGKLTIYTMTLDHKIARSRRQDLRFVLTNLAPASVFCNKAKGSKSMEEYIACLKQKQALPNPPEQINEDTAQTITPVSVSSVARLGAPGDSIT